MKRLKNIERHWHILKPVSDSSNIELCVEVAEGRIDRKVRSVVLLCDHKRTGTIPLLANIAI